MLATAFESAHFPPESLTEDDLPARVRSALSTRP